MCDKFGYSEARQELTAASVVILAVKGATETASKLNPILPEEPMITVKKPGRLRFASISDSDSEEESI